MEWTRYIYDGLFKVEKYKENSFITCDLNGDVVIFDLLTSIKRSLSIQTLDFYFRDSFIYVIDLEFKLQKYECASLELVKCFELSDKSTSVNVSKDAEYIAYAIERELSVIKQSTGEKFQFENNESVAIQLCFDHDNKFIVCGFTDGVILIYGLDMMIFVHKLDFSNNISFFIMKNRNFMERKEVISWHKDGHFFSILNNKQVMYCEKHTWKLKYRFDKYNLRQDEYYSALSYSTNKQYIFVLTNLNKIISFYIVNSEILMEHDLTTRSAYCSFAVLERTLIVSYSDGKLIGLPFYLKSSFEESEASANVERFDKIDIEEKHTNHKTDHFPTRTDFSIFKHKKTKFVFKKNK
jgi:WD40 repeat protein